MAIDYSNICWPIKPAGIKFDFNKEFKSTEVFSNIGAALPMLLLLILLQLQAVAQVRNVINIYPAPPGSTLSSAYRVSVASRPVAVYMAKVCAADPVRRFKAVDDIMHSEDYYDNAAFAYFDMHGTATVNVAIAAAVKNAKILPASAGIRARINGNAISFKVSKPQNLTIEINGEVVKSLHLFINPVDKNKPSAKDPNVIFFGPGIHEVSSMLIGDNKTVYVAGGAVIKAVIDRHEHYNVEPVGLKGYAPTFQLIGHHIKFRGRGIIDATACTTHARNMIFIHGSDINIEGVILVNSSGWTVPIRQSQNVSINNIKLLGYRANSDGIDICNSQNVTVTNSFIRTNDDLIVVKTELGEGPANHILVKKCVLWNQLANALSLGAEIRADVNDVVFTDCDIIHDYSRAWCLRVFHTDASMVSNITFDNIRLEEAHLFISLWIGKTVESYDKLPGHIKNVLFKDIKAYGGPLNIDIVGAGEQNKIENVQFQNIWLNGRALTRDDVKNNPFVSGIVLQP